MRIQRPSYAVDSALLRSRRHGGGEQVNADLRNLIALQDLELRIASLQKQAAEIPNQIQSLNHELQKIQAEHQERVARAKELANKRRTLEGEVDMLSAKCAM